MNYLIVELFQGNGFSVKDGVSEIIKPIPHNGRQSMVASLVLHGLVLVAENKEVNAGVELSLLLGILVKAGFGNVVVIATFHFVLELFQAVIV